MLERKEARTDEFASLAVNPEQLASNSEMRRLLEEAVEFRSGSRKRKTPQGTYRDLCTGNPEQAFYE